MYPNETSQTSMTYQLQVLMISEEYAFSLPLSYWGSN